MCSQSLREKLHHMCQTEYASAGGLKELDNVTEKKICPKHVGDFYALGVLTSSYDEFNKIAANFIPLASVCTPNPPKGSDCAPNAKEM